MGNYLISSQQISELADKVHTLLGLSGAERFDTSKSVAKAALAILAQVTDTPAPKLEVEIAVALASEDQSQESVCAFIHLGNSRHFSGSMMNEIDIASLEEIDDFIGDWQREAKKLNAKLVIGQGVWDLREELKEAENV